MNFEAEFKNRTTLEHYLCERNIKPDTVQLRDTKNLLKLHDHRCHSVTYEIAGPQSNAYVYTFEWLDTVISLKGTLLGAEYFSLPRHTILEWATHRQINLLERSAFCEALERYAEKFLKLANLPLTERIVYFSDEHSIRTYHDYSVDVLMDAEADVVHSHSSAVH